MNFLVAMHTEILPPVPQPITSPKSLQINVIADVGLRRSTGGQAEKIFTDSSGLSGHTHPTISCSACSVGGAVRNGMAGERIGLLVTLSPLLSLPCMESIRVSFLHVNYAGYFFPA